MSEPPATDRAVAELRGLGLTEYAAKAFVALHRIGEGTARTVAEVSGVPRSRVYDVLDELHRDGLVDVQQASPRVYRPLGVDVAVERFRQRHERSVVGLREAIADLDDIDGESEDDVGGVWTLKSRERLLGLEERLVTEATDRILIGIATDAVLDAATFEHISMAAEADAAVTVEAPSAAAQQRIAERADDVEVLAASQPWTGEVELDGDIGRILVVDGREVLVSTVETSGESTDREVGVWSQGTGAGTGVVVAMMELMLDRVEEARNGDQASSTTSR